MIIEPIDLLSAPEPEARAAFAVATEVEDELVPEGPSVLLEQEVDFQHSMGSWTRVVHLVAWEDDSRSNALGLALLEWEDLEENADLGDLAIWVRSEARRRGVGTALACAALPRLAEAGRTKVATGVWEGSPGEGFAAALGMEPKLRERYSRCHVSDLDQGMLQSWVERAAERADGYSLLTWEGRTPEEHVEEFARILNFMNTAPLDDFEMEDRITTPDMVRERDDGLEKAQIRRFVSVVRHDETGEFAGFTAINIDRWHPEQAHQGGTCTHTDHRNRGIGRWLKAANALRVLEACPEIAYIDTDNAGSNRPMLNINEAMGFRPRRHRWAYQAPLSVVEERLSSR